MGLLKVLANAGLKATEKVVGGTAKVAGKVIGGTAKVAGKAIGGTAKVVGKGVASGAGNAASRAVGKAVLKKSGLTEPVGGYNYSFEQAVGRRTIKAVSGGLKFVGRHKKEVLIAGASLKAADSISHMLNKRDDDELDIEDDFDKEDYKMSMSKYLDTSKKRVLYRICKLQTNNKASNLKENSEGRKLLKKVIKNSKIIDFMDLRSLNAYYEIKDNSMEKLEFIVVTDSTLLLLKKNNDKTFFSRQDYNFKAFF